jgi:hypothetical protein
MSLILARFGHDAMSELSLLSGVTRTSRLRPPTSDFDPNRTFCLVSRRFDDCDYDAEAPINAPAQF